MIEKNPYPKRRVLLLIADGAGIGEAPDEAAYGTPGANTLSHVGTAAGPLAMPYLEKIGLGHLTPISGLASTDRPEGVIGRLVESSAGVDTPTGHWELCGVMTDTAPPTYPNGFPVELLDAFCDAVGLPRGHVLGNCPENGEKIIARLGPEHQATGAPIVYTSADSVFQIAVHTDVVPLDELYRWCEAAREICTGEHAVGRIIARPFEGEPGAYHRRAERRDLALPPPRPTACERLDDAGIEVIGIGKTADIFARVGITTELHPNGLEAGCAATAEVLANHDGPAFILTNLVDFDTLYGHVRDPQGYAAALEQLDGWCVKLNELLRPGDVILISADHGNDPTFIATNDHTRERVPLVAWGPGIAGADLGTRAMADVGPTLCDLFAVHHPGMDGTSFADHLQGAS